MRKASGTAAISRILTAPGTVVAFRACEWPRIATACVWFPTRPTSPFRSGTPNRSAGDTVAFTGRGLQENDQIKC